MVLRSMTLGEIAQMLGGQVKGDPQTTITGVNGIQEAGRGDITFLANPKYKDKLPQCQASAVFVGPGVETDALPVIVVENPRLAFAKLVTAMLPKRRETGEVSPMSYVAPTALIGEKVTVYPGVHVGERSQIGANTVLYPGVFVGDDVNIGQDCLIYANVTINHHCRIHDRVTIGSGTVVGSEGFGYERDGEKHFKVPQAGNVIIEEDVEIGALCAIDRGSVKATVLGAGTKLDNLIHVAHNCNIGPHNLLLSQVGLAGTVKTGKHVYVAGQSGVLDHINIVDQVQVGPRSVVTGNIEEAGQYYGYPAKPYREWQKANALFYSADDLRKKVLDLEKRLAQLEGKPAEP